MSRATDANDNGTSFNPTAVNLLHDRRDQRRDADPESRHRLDSRNRRDGQPVAGCDQHRQQCQSKHAGWRRQVPTPAGAGNNIVIGGIGDDTIDIGGTKNTVLGDDGQAIYTSTGLIASIASTDAGFGGNDIINVSGGGNIIIGGVGADTITSADRTTPSSATMARPVTARLASTCSPRSGRYPTDGGNDVIDVAGGDNAIIGGYGADTITVGGPDNTILGDNGAATFRSDHRRRH